MVYIKQVYNSMTSLSRIIIKIGFAIVAFIFIVSVIILLFGERFFADYTTAYYWYEQCILLGKEMLGSTVVPVMLFELIMTIIFPKKSNP